MKLRKENWGHVHYDSHNDEFSARLDGENTLPDRIRPLSAGCLVTGKCNLRCAFCYGNLEALPTVEMSCNEWRMAFQRLRDLGIMRVDLSGGEPTLRQDIRELAAAACELDLNVIVSTNGLVLHKRGPAGFPSETRFHVSIDSAIAAVHEKSRRLPTLGPSVNSLEKSCDFIKACLEAGHHVRVLTCIGPHNEEFLFALGERIAVLGVIDWNISKILRAGRANTAYETAWTITADNSVGVQVSYMREAYPWMRIRYSDRTAKNGYFLLVLPDGTVATQFTDGRDKVAIGCIQNLSVEALKANPNFDLREHAEKWIAEMYGFQEGWISEAEN